MGKSLLFDARSRMPVPATELFSWHAREGAFERLMPPWEAAELVERTGEWPPGGRPAGDADEDRTCATDLGGSAQKVRGGLALPGRAGVRPLRKLGPHPPDVARAPCRLGAGG